MKKLLTSLLLCVCATGAHAATDYTGDSIEGVKVIRKLDLSDLDAGKVHRFYLQGASNGVGQHWLVPILVAKGIPFLIALPAAGLLAAVIGVLVALPAVRLSGMYLMIMTIKTAARRRASGGTWLPSRQGWYYWEGPPKSSSPAAP